MISDSFYKKAAEILRKTRTDKNAACWKTLACADDVRDKKLMYALLSEVCKYRDALEHVATAAGLFKAEPRISPELLLIGTYEVLFRADARCSETLVAPIKRHKTRLHAELVKLKIKRGVTCNTQLATQSAADRFPRFVRVNTLKSTLQEICAVFERLQLKRGTLQRAADGSLAFADSLSYAIDDHVDNLLALPRSVSLANTPAYKQGKIIIQDKSSCFPAFVLAPPPGAAVMDVCAAPGNKTTHLAMLMQGTGRLVAFEKDAVRFATLKKMVSLAVPTHASMVQLQHADFLTIDPLAAAYADITHALVDPSCSGSGMLHRLEEEAAQTDDALGARLEALAAFQVRIVLHAMRFSAVRRVTYSTCSVHDAENEDVVRRVLEACEGRFVLERALPSWKHRGHVPFEACVRVEPAVDGISGFFVALFVRRD